MTPTTNDQRPTTKIILALDIHSHRQAMRWVRLLYPKIKIFKVGLQLYTAYGPRIIQDIRKIGAEVFLDLKFNDIPNTMVNAAKEVLRHKVAMFSVHTLSGPTALKEVAGICRGSKTKVLGVTILTSICAHFLKDLKIQRSLSAEVLYLAKMAQRCGLDGIVCSAQEAALLRRQMPKKFLLVTPGIRPEGADIADQRRAATAKEAIHAGSDYLVIGRPILEAADPLRVTQELQESLWQKRLKI